MGDLNGAPVLASETCAFDIIGARYVRDIENGEIIIISDEGVESIKPFPKLDCRPCIFERIYFARPDSIVGNKSVYSYRKELGAELARENSIGADVVVPVPDSGVPAALGFSQQADIPFEFGIIRNHYVGRTFIEPSQKIRSLGVKLKLSTTKSLVKDKSVLLIQF